MIVLYLSLSLCVVYRLSATGQLKYLVYWTMVNTNRDSIIILPRTAKCIIIFRRRKYCAVPVFIDNSSTKND